LRSSIYAISEKERNEMTDANALANLQMLMNTGDGRCEVLNELFHADNMPREMKQGERISFLEQFCTNNPNLYKRLESLKHLRQSATENQSDFSQNIIALLDHLPVQDKAPLTEFIDGLASHYDNLFMGLIGHISIVMYRIKPTHPSHLKLRECEALIMNTSILIRFLVDVFRHSANQKEVLYPTDLSDHEIYRRVFPKHIFNYPMGKLKQSKTCVQVIMVVFAGSIAETLKKTFNKLYQLLNEAFQYPELEGNYLIIHYYRGMLCLNKGFQLANDLRAFNKD
jgi:hypothetical protein